MSQVALKRVCMRDRIRDTLVGRILDGTYPAGTQLKELYRNNWETFTSAGALTSYGPRDPTTAEYLAKLSAERTIDVAGETHDAEGRRSTSISRQRRENVMPHQFEQLGKGRMFVRLPSDRAGLVRYITEVADFTERADVPEQVRALGRG